MCVACIIYSLRFFIESPRAYYQRGWTIWFPDISPPLHQNKDCPFHCFDISTLMWFNYHLFRNSCLLWNLPGGQTVRTENWTFVQRLGWHYQVHFKSCDYQAAKSMFGYPIILTSYKFQLGWGLWNNMVYMGKYRLKASCSNSFAVIFSDWCGRCVVHLPQETESKYLSKRQRSIYLLMTNNFSSSSGYYCVPG